MLDYTYKVETCKKEGDDFEPIISASFISSKLAEKFINRNSKEFKNLRKRISCYKEGNLIFSRYFWD